MGLFSKLLFIIFVIYTDVVFSGSQLRIWSANETDDDVIHSLIHHDGRADNRTRMSAAIADAISPTAIDSCYFPLEIGKQWVFVWQSVTMVETIVDTQRIGGNLYFLFDRFRTYAGYPYSVGFLFRMAEDRVFICVDSVECLWYDFTANVGDHWKAPEGPLDPYAAFCATRFLLHSKSDTVETPLGIFTGCYLFEHLIGMDCVIFEWLAPGIGIVQREVFLYGGVRRWTLIETKFTSVRSKTKSDIPTAFFLLQNYPNPFNSETVIPYELQRTAYVYLTVYNIGGEEVMTLAHERQAPGRYQVVWNGRDKYGTEVSSGVYFCELRAGTFTQVRKIILNR